jgi:hypothetical protein
VAAYDEVLENESPAGQLQLVGSDSLSRGSIGLWLWKLRKLNGPNFTYPLPMFAGASRVCAREDG